MSKYFDRLYKRYTTIKNQIGLIYDRAEQNYLSQSEISSAIDSICKEYKFDKLTGEFKIRLEVLQSCRYEELWKYHLTTGMVDKDTNQLVDLSKVIYDSKQHTTITFWRADPSKRF